MSTVMTRRIVYTYNGRCRLCILFNNGLMYGGCQPPLNSSSFICLPKFRDVGLGSFVYLNPYHASCFHCNSPSKKPCGKVLLLHEKQ
jgi:hypothetical protein